jgi:hypothetical protein
MCRVSVRVSVTVLYDMCILYAFMLGYGEKLQVSVTLDVYVSKYKRYVFVFIYVYVFVMS